jgi:hypothetical protein
MAAWFDERRDRWTALADAVARRSRPIPLYQWLCQRLWAAALKRALRG